MRKILSLIICILILGSFTACGEKNTAYEQAVDLGYNGTAEEWMAALAAENITDADGNIPESAFEVAQKKGYTGTIEQWYESLGINLNEITEEN